MWGYGGWNWLWMMPAMLVFWAIAIGLIVWAVRATTGPGPGGDPALQTRLSNFLDTCYGAALQVAYNEFGIRGSVCQSSPSGAGVWGRMGYQPLTRYLRYIGKPQATTWG